MGFYGKFDGNLEVRKGLTFDTFAGCLSKVLQLHNEMAISGDTVIISID